MNSLGNQANNQMLYMMGNPQVTQENIQGELVAAAKRNDPESASLAMRLGADALLGDINGWTPLHWASAANSVDVATLLINSGAPLEAMTVRTVEFSNGVVMSSLTPLHVASIFGSSTVAKLLLDCGADFNVCDNLNGTPYHVAPLWSNDNVTQALNQTSKKHQRRPTPLIVDHDVLNKHAKQWMPCSPIFLEGQPESCRSPALDHGDYSPRLEPPPSFVCPISLSIMKDPVMLLETQQTFDRKSIEEWFQLGGWMCPVTKKRLQSNEYITNRALRNAIEEWTEMQLKDCASQQALSDASTPLSQYHHALSPVSPTDFSFYSQDPQMQQELLQAARSDDAATVQLLLGCGMPLTTCDSNGWTALHWAANGNAIDVMKLLLSLNAPLEAKTTEKVNVDGSVWAESTALHVAAGFKSTHAAQMLLDAGANPSSCDSLGGTPLHSASFWGNIEIVQALIRAGANVAAVTNSKSSSTPLHYAARQGHAVVCEMLIHSFKATSRVSRTTMRSVEEFLNATNSNNQSALHLAAFAGHSKVVEVLLSNGADKFIKNKSGKVPGQLICRGAVDWLPTSALADVKQHLRSLLV